jgi:hypothetical protein
MLDPNEAFKVSHLIILQINHICSMKVLNNELKKPSSNLMLQCTRNHHAYKKARYQMTNYNGWFHFHAYKPLCVEKPKLVIHVD